MSDTNEHPKMYPMSVCTSDGIEFETESTKNMKGKVMQSDFHTAMLPWNRAGVGSVTEKDASIKKYRQRYGGSFGNISLGDIVKNNG